MLETVKNKMNPETFLEASENANKIPEHLLNIYHQKINNGKNQLKFDDTIRIFALSLHLKSASAYRYVRKTFGKALPSESTLRRWCSKMDCSPGFNSMALKLLHIKVEERAKKGQKMFISMAIDEMAIHKSWTQTGKD